jgi:hypothetical protein
VDVDEIAKSMVALFKISDEDEPIFCVGNTSTMLFSVTVRFAKIVPPVVFSEINWSIFVEFPEA